MPPDAETHAARAVEQLLSTGFSPDFLRSTYGSSVAVARDCGGELAALLEWSDVDRVLSEQRLQAPRVRVMRSGGQVKPAAYSDIRMTRRGEQYWEIDPARLYDVLSEGGTLVIDAIDQCHAPLRDAAAGFEMILHAPAQVNAYMSFGTGHGLDVHWDDHDVFAVHLDGVKSWQVFGPSRRYPLYRDVRISSERPSHVLCEASLGRGDVLYIPRGWWHQAEPVRSPGLHLTFGVSNRTGIDLIGWMEDRLRHVELFRKDLPRFTSRQEQQAHLRALKDAWEALWDQEVLATYFADEDAMAEGLRRFSLPSAVSADTAAFGAGTRFTLLSIRRPTVGARPEGSLRMRALGKEWTFEPASPAHLPAAQSLLTELLNARSLDYQDVQRLASSDGELKTLLHLLGSLARSGLIAVEQTTPASREDAF